MSFTKNMLQLSYASVSTEAKIDLLYCIVGHSLNAIL